MEGYCTAVPYLQAHSLIEPAREFAPRRVEVLRSEEMGIGAEDGGVCRVRLPSGAPAPFLFLGLERGCADLWRHLRTNHSDH